ncbi:E3 ubiquitin-protein ligase TRIM33 isoform X1 [Nymphalis io]|uniref:E3 ubiquitin-protein ligase TRIM33 isoform X1 n=1 Tax=Inachis io TaxID=171585 RepID=UPI00216A7DE6|nr:E3 ubiquitin-protein ligase TRIM33 isoform X1 [Nymphalis io]
MENASFSAGAECGEEIERALMDLGPFLGVTIKEETPDELTEGTATRANLQMSGTSAPTEGAPESAEGAAGGKAEGEGADSLASPTARTSFLAMRCVFCQLPLSQAEGTPKLMECLHSACEPCIKAKIDEKLAGSRDFLGAGRVTILCSACRLHCQPSNMIDQRFVIEKTALEQTGTNGSMSGEQQCNSCEDTEPATSYCVDCGEFICDNCVHAHQRLKITKDHTIKSKEEAVSELQAAQGGRAAHDMYCRDHPQERLALFCETCDRLTCRDCQLQHHRDHKYQFSTEMAAQARGGIAALLSEVSYKRVLLGSAMKVIRDRQALIADKKKALVHEITQTVVKLTNAINTRGKQLVLRLNEVCDAKQRTLSEKKDALEQLAAITDHCVDFVNTALEQGSDTAVLHSKRAVCAHLQRIKSRRADIPNPEIPVRISLALDKLPDLVRVLSNIGAIVVDGKVDGGGSGGSGVSGGGGGAGGGGGGAGGGGGGAAGSPGPAGVFHAGGAPPHSAVVALQQVAMHQSYVQAVTGATGPGVVVGVGGASSAMMGGVGVGVPGMAGVGGYMAMQRSRAHTPLRHPHVTSTTHPHHLHGMNEMNLRGLLNSSGARGRPPAPPQHAQHAQHAQHVQHAQHAYHQMMGAYGNGAYGASAGGGAASGRRSGGPRTPSPAPLAHPPSAKWHIPQHALPNGALEAGAGASAAAGGSLGGADYKITLGRARTSSAVTSTNPKTPSPSLNGVSAGCASELDKVCAESVQDLMATIAKLDSNGVQVVAEQSGGDASPAAVHSSTDAPGRAAGDPNEDWCAVCMDGGELMCCDKCPKVFHQYCHIPTIEKLPEETESWQCLLCVNFAEYAEGEAGVESEAGELTGRVRRIAERITLELYCQYEQSLPFREPVPPHNRHYHSKIQRPMCLDMIRLKLQPSSEGRYTHISQFVADVRLLFRNAYRYNPPDSQINKDAKKLEDFFDAQLVKWLPDYTYWSGEGSPPAKRARCD